jgi:hypothetical protein
MTTPAAAAQYLNEHLRDWKDHEIAFYNPHGKPLAELPIIYGFNNGGSPGWYSGVLLAESGHCLGGHVCSAESYMMHDLGILDGARPDRHQTFREHYPDGYRMEFVPSGSIDPHQGLMAAYARHQELAKGVRHERPD